MADIGGSAIEASEPSVGPDLAGLRGLRVLRLCSVFEPATLNPGAARYDVIGGMQNHAAELTRCLDRMGVRQLVLTSRLDGPPGRAGFGRYGQVARTGLRTPLARQAWAPAAARLALGNRGLVSLVHAHCGEDLAVLPLARLAAWRHGCPLVVTVHVSVRHTLRVTSARTAMLRLAGGLAEGRVLPWADMVIVLTRPAADRLLREGQPESSIRVIPPGYDPDLFTAVMSDPLPHLPRPRVAYIGRIARQKDVGTLVEAFGRVGEHGCCSSWAMARTGRPPSGWPGRWPGECTSPGSSLTPASRRCCGTAICWCWPPGTRSCHRCWWRAWQPACRWLPAGSAGYPPWWTTT
jgi:hypothetical protein